MGKEFELKYAATAEAFAALTASFAGGQEIKMETTYFDTPSAALSARKWTLRLRRENGMGVVTFKTAGDGKTRGEWEYAAETVADAAEKLVSLGAPKELEALLAEGIAPVCGAAFLRRAVSVTEGDAVLELALDEGILFRCEKKLPIREVEVELKTGTEEACRAFGEKLAAQYGLQEEPRSKFVRAVNL